MRVADVRVADMRVADTRLSSTPAATRIRHHNANHLYCMSDSGKPDTLFANPLGKAAEFSFDRQVVEVFPDMIRRSVPGYATIISMIGTLAERYALQDSRCYDLGCSLGAATLAMRHRIRAANCSIVAVDNSPAMVQQCRRIIEADSGEVPVELLCVNLQNVT